VRRVSFRELIELMAASRNDRKEVGYICRIITPEQRPAR
jgi:hypothetical protein